MLKIKELYYATNRLGWVPGRKLSIIWSYTFHVAFVSPLLTWEILSSVFKIAD